MILAVSVSYAIWAWRNRDNTIDTRFPNIVHGYRNRSAKTTWSYIMLFGNGRRLNSTVCNHTNNVKLGSILRWFCHYLFHMQCEHEGVEIILSILDSETDPTENDIDQRKLHHQTSCCFDTTGNSTRQYQFMLTIEKSAKFPHMEHIARRAANHLIPKPYGIP